MKRLFGIIAITLMISMLYSADTVSTTLDSSAQTQVVVQKDSPIQAITIPKIIDSVLQGAEEHWYTIPTKKSSPEKWAGWVVGGVLLLMGLLKWIINAGKSKNIDVPFDKRQ